MLNKEDRVAIAERARIATCRKGSIYEVLFGCVSPVYKPLEDDFRDMISRILDLCDTSNMVELPLDKDGEVIHIGDTVYDDDREWKVSCVKCSDDSSIISVYSDNGCTVYRPDELTHKKPVTIASITERIREITSNDDDISYCTSSELVRIADQLEKLGDSDD